MNLYLQLPSKSNVKYTIKKKLSYINITEEEGEEEGEKEEEAVRLTN